MYPGLGVDHGPNLLVQLGNPNIFQVTRSWVFGMEFFKLINECSKIDVISKFRGGGGMFFRVTKTIP